MDEKMNMKHILEQVQNGGLTVEEAEKYLKKESFEEMGFAKLDMQRELRTGFQEVVYCAGKPDSYLISIFQTLYEKNGEVFGTRATPEQYELVRQSLPQIEYDAVSRILKMEQNPAEKAANRIGSVVVCTAGTADIPVAEEAAQTAEYFGREEQD